MTPNGPMVMGFASTLWFLFGLRASGHGTPALYLLGLGVGALILGTAIRLGARVPPRPEAEQRRSGRLLAWASGAEGLAIFLAANLTRNLHHPELFAPCLAIIVGLHFVPLAWGLPAPAYYFSALALVGVGLLGLAVPAADQRMLVLSLAGPAVIWLTCGCVLMALLRRYPAGSPVSR